MSDRTKAAITPTVREQARAALEGQPAHRRAANAEACADVVSDVWEPLLRDLLHAIGEYGYGGTAGFWDAVAKVENALDPKNDGGEG